MSYITYYLTMKLYIKFTIILLIPYLLNSEETRKKVFFDRIAMDIGKSVPEEVVIRVVSEIGETIVQVYSNEYLMWRGSWNQKMLSHDAS